jgi:hypothetical protein
MKHQQKWRAALLEHLSLIIFIARRVQLGGGAGNE